MRCDTVEVIQGFLISTQWGVVYIVHMVCNLVWVHRSVCVFVCAQLVTQLGGFEEVSLARKWTLLTKEVRSHKSHSFFCMIAMIWETTFASTMIR